MSYLLFSLSELAEFHLSLCILSSTEGRDLDKVFFRAAPERTEFQPGCGPYGPELLLVAEVLQLPDGTAVA